MADEKEKESNAPKVSKYIGPYYKNAIVMPNGKRLDPRNWTEKEIEEKILAYPIAKTWFK